MGEPGRPQATTQAQLPFQGKFDGPDRPNEVKREVGQLPGLDWAQVAFENQRPQQPAAQKGGAARRKAANAGAQPLQAGDRPVANPKLEDQKTADLLAKTILELR